MQLQMISSVFILIAIRQIHGLCVAPINPHGYDSSSKTETSLTSGCSFSVTNWKCAAGFSGSPVASSCITDGFPYNLRGCSAEGNSFCKLASPSSCRGQIHEFVLDRSGTLFTEKKISGLGYRSLDFADLDGDGDMDMVLGTHNSVIGNVRYFENIDATLPTLEEHVGNANPFHQMTNSDVRVTGVRLVDQDEDGDLDIVFGSISGKILYYKNIGNATVPMYQIVDGVENVFAHIGR